ncbi:hypothetical protein ACFX13_040482 [Malus domestica]
MGRMKSNCRKAAMETQQQHIQVDLVLTLMVKFYGGSIFMRELCFQASPKRLQVLGWEWTQEQGVLRGGEVVASSALLQ